MPSSRNLSGGLKRMPLCRQQVCGSLEHLFVDEFQDLNESQFELVRILAEAAQVFAIGDPDQAIYGFRGSDPEFFFRFAKMPGVEQVFLTRNYRCPSAIITAATALISHNRAQSGTTAGRAVCRSLPNPAGRAPSNCTAHRHRRPRPNSSCAASRS